MDTVRVNLIGIDPSPKHSGAYAIVLREDGGARQFSFLVGAEIAQAIALELEQITPPRPMTHDLLKSVIEAYGGSLAEVVIHDRRDDTYYAKMVLEPGGMDIDTRPSDAIAVAIRCGAPIHVARSVMDAAGTIPDEGNGE